MDPNNPVPNPDHTSCPECSRPKRPECWCIYCMRDGKSPMKLSDEANADKSSAPEKRGGWS
jgi:hypothetical protein